MGGRYIGFTPCRSPLRVEPAHEEIGGLDRLLEWLLPRDYVDVDVFHTCVSIYIWMALVWRPALSVLHASFNLVRERLEQGLVDGSR